MMLVSIFSCANQSISCNAFLRLCSGIVDHFSALGCNARFPGLALGCGCGCGFSWHGTSCILRFSQFPAAWQGLLFSRVCTFGTLPCRTRQVVFLLVGPALYFPPQLAPAFSRAYIGILYVACFPALFSSDLALRFNWFILPFCVY